MSTQALSGDENTTIEQLLKEAYATRIADLKKATGLAKKALQQSRDIKDQGLIGRSCNMLSLFYMIMGDYAPAIANAEEAIAYFEILEDEHGIADAKYNLAGVYYKTDNYHLGLTFLIDSLTTYKKFDDHHNQARTHKSLGTIYEYIGDVRNAERAYEACIAAANKINDVNLVSNAYNPLSGIYLKQGKLKKASDMIDEAISTKNKSGDIRGLAFSLYGRAKIYISTRQYEQAERDLNAALEIHTRENERLGKAMALYRMGLLYFKMGTNERAKAVLKQAIEFSTEFKITIVKFKAYYLLYEIHKKENNTHEALHCLELYLKQKEAVINTQTLKVIENYGLIVKMEGLQAEAKANREKAEIIEKKELAEKTARIKQDFLSAMSHEIRTPLNAIIGIASLLEDRQDPGEKELIESLKFASKSLLMIINDILDFNKLDAGKVELEPRACEIRLLLNNLLHTYEHLALLKGLQISLTVAENIFDSYELDEVKLTQILGNLISNAIKYTDQGSVHVGVKDIYNGPEEDAVRFTVSDTGVGIAETHFDKLFDSFSQPKTVTTRKQGGSGLGLAIVKKMVTLHGSEVVFSSVINKGSVFSFDLHLKKCVSTTAPVIDEFSTILPRAVLLAEDNMINALVARKLLAKWGISADHAKNGLEAVSMSAKKVYDIILMDIHMPEMNGFDATNKIRNAQGLNCKTPIYALTADITAKDQTEYADFFTGFLNKPIEIDKLQKAVTGKLYQ